MPPGPALVAAGAEAGVVYIGAGALVAIELCACVRNESAYPINAMVKANKNDDNHSTYPN